MLRLRTTRSATPSGPVRDCSHSSRPIIYTDYPTPLLLDAESGLSAYQVPAGVNPHNQTVFSSPWGEGFPVEWSPRYAIAAGFAAMVDQYEDYSTRNGSRETSTLNKTTNRYQANIADAPKGFFISGNLPTNTDSGVHSLVDVGVYSWGPGSELFAGMQDSTRIAQKIAQALSLGCDKNKTMSVHRRAVEF